MSHGPELHTHRLLLRRWRPSDIPPFVALNADPAVMEHFVSALSERETRAYAEQIEKEFEDHGYGMWVVEVPGETPFAGYVGLSDVGNELPFGPTVEVGWRLTRPSWGKGYATEAAGACLDYGFDVLGLDEIVATTVPANHRSWRVMERLGMRRDESGDFEHPSVPEGHRLRLHVLYRLRADTWRSNRPA